MRLPLFQVDAFTDRLFGGNPAAVVPLDVWLDDQQLAAIAAENNLSETAFLVPRNTIWELRWFTPETEVALCGHATLAAAHVICQFIEPSTSQLTFVTRESGELLVNRRDDSYEMVFPALASQPNQAEPVLIEALGVPPLAVRAGHYSATEYDLLAIFSDQAAVQALQPDFAKLRGLAARGVICTAAAADTGVDFVSRYFCPEVGVPEDPVTGSAHCLLTQYWSHKLAKTTLEARQLSARGGAIRCTLNGDRVHLVGKAVSYLQGVIEI